MKKTIFFAAILFCTLGVMSAQVSEGSVLISTGSHNAFSVDLEGADFKKAEKVWKEYMKPYGKFDKDRKKKEFRAHEMRIPALNSDKIFSVTLKLDERRNMTTAHVLFQDQGAYVSTENMPDLAGNIENFVLHYQHEVDRLILREILEDEEKTLKNLSKDLNKLMNKNEDLHDDIEKYEKKIVEAEQNIEKNLKEQDEKNYEIEQQQKRIKKLTEEMNSIGKN